MDERRAIFLVKKIEKRDGSVFVLIDSLANIPLLLDALLCKKNVDSLSIR